MTPSRSSPSQTRSDRVKFDEKVSLIPRSPPKEEKTSEEEKPAVSSTEDRGRPEGMSKRQKRRFRQKESRKTGPTQEKGKGKGDQVKKSEKDRSPTPHPAARKVMVQQ